MHRARTPETQREAWVRLPLGVKRARRERAGLAGPMNDTTSQTHFWKRTKVEGYSSRDVAGSGATGRHCRHRGGGTRKNTRVQDAVFLKLTSQGRSRQVVAWRGCASRQTHQLHKEIRTDKKKKVRLHVLADASTKFASFLNLSIMLAIGLRTSFTSTNASPTRTSQ